MLLIEKYIQNCQARFGLSECEWVKVESYSIPGSFLKLEYLKTELKEENGTYAIV